MPRFDLPLAQLRTHRPEVREPADFDAFWRETLAEARTAGAAPSVAPYRGHLRGIDIHDVRFPGFAGDPVAAWLLVPKGLREPASCVVSFHGYGGGRGLPYSSCLWACAGHVQLDVDTRGQGSLWGAGGDTPDPHGTGPSVPGFMTRGITDPRDYYYRRVLTDAVRAVDFARTVPEVDPSRVVVCGASQGGGMALAAGALARDVAAVMADVPFLCHFEHAVGLTGAEPYAEISRFLATHHGAAERVFTTLSYFDGVNFARRITAPTRMSVGLFDEISPPSTVFAAANHLAGPAEMDVYEFNAHEGGGIAQWDRQASWLARLLPPREPAQDAVSARP